MARDGFIEFLLEMMQELDGVTARKMFGGHGIYRDGLMFGLVADETLYLKVDDESRPEFDARELGPFVYHKGGKPFAMSYHLAPPEALEEPARMTEWAERGFAAAVRGARKKGAKGAGRMGAKKSSKRAGMTAKKSAQKNAKKKAAKKQSKAKRKKAAGSRKKVGRQIAKKTASKKARGAKKKPS